MSSPQELSPVNSVLSGPDHPTSNQRIRLLHCIRSSLPLFQNLISFPAPKASDRAQVQSKEVRPPDSPPIYLDDMDVQIAVVFDRGLEADLLADIQEYLEDLFDSGLRQRIIALIKELKQEEPEGSGGPHTECYIIDFRGAVVERKAIVSQERLLLSHCLVLSVLVLQMKC